MGKSVFQWNSVQNIKIVSPINDYQTLIIDFNTIWGHILIIEFIALGAGGSYLSYFESK